MCLSYSFLDDKVANVRSSLCNIMSNLVEIFKVSTEKPLITKLNSTINKLLLDEDRIVQEHYQLLENCNISINVIIQVNYIL